MRRAPGGQRTVVFFPEGAFGPTNNCIGIGSVLQRRGHRVVFVVEESFAGTLEAQGFEEVLMRLKPKPEKEEEPGQFWKDFIRETAPHFRESSYLQLETLTLPIWTELVDGAMYVEARLSQIFRDLQPDVIVEDNVVAFPAVHASGFPWVRIVSCNPLEIQDAMLPPALSGLPLADPGEWSRFRARFHALHADLHRTFDSFCQQHGCPPLPVDEFMYSSPYLNLYNYPGEADYPRSTPLPSTWHRLESCVRSPERDFDLDPRLPAEGPTVYLSLGSLGSADTALMRRLIDLLAATEYRVIVSMGPQHEVLQLPDHMYGEEFLPQISVLPLVDLVITHGGNNTVTECFHVGKPMIVLPLFWDQHDNAQRVHETGFGIRLHPYDFEDDALYDAMTHLLADRQLHARMRTISRRLQSHPGTERSADLIERVAEGG